MTNSASGRSGYFASGQPFNRFGHGPASLVVFQGMQFENRPLSSLSARFLRSLYKPGSDLPPAEATALTDRK